MKKNSNTSQAERMASLKDAYQDRFLQTILSFSSLLPHDVFRAMADKSISQASLSFSNEIKPSWRLPLPEEQEKKWLSLCKYTYHLAIAETLAGIDIENEIAVAFLQMNGACADYLAWYYTDHFTLAQMSAITGQTAAVIRKEIYYCRKLWQEQIKFSSSLLPDKTVDENRFGWLTDYFDNHLSGQNEITLAEQLNNGDENTDKNNALELIFYYRLAGNSLLKEQEDKMKKTFLPAKDFIEIARRGIEQQNQNNTPL